MLPSSISAFQTFKMSVGPSSSHTHGPILIGNLFRRYLAKHPEFHEFQGLKVTLYWSLARTGKGHATDNAIIAGLAGLDPVKDSLDDINGSLERIKQQGSLDLGVKTVPFVPNKHLVWSPYKRLPGHENGLSIALFDQDGKQMVVRNYYSVGGGMVQEEG